MEEKLEEKLDQILCSNFSGYREIAGGWNYRYHHLKSVRKYAVKLAEKTDAEVDRKVLEIAAMFHDIGRSSDIEGDTLDPMEEHEGHAEKGADMIPEVLGDYLPEDEIEKIQRVVRNHHSEPKTSEGKIVQDADLLFKYGVQNLWRKFHYSAQHDETLPEALKYFERTEEDRLENKLEDLHFMESKEIAEERLKKLSETVERIRVEQEGEDIL